MPVFDISQTTATADDLPKIFPNRPYNFDLTKATNTKLLYQSLETYALSEGLTIIDDLTTVTPVLGTAKGAYGQGIDGSEMLFMNPRFTQAEQVPTMIHELAHAKLHSKRVTRLILAQSKNFKRSWQRISLPTIMALIRKKNRFLILRLGQRMDRPLRINWLKWKR